jgi:hypothetical protein
MMDSSQSFDSDTEHHLRELRIRGSETDVDEAALARMAAQDEEEDDFSYRRGRSSKRKSWVSGKFRQSYDSHDEADNESSEARFSNADLGVDDAQTRSRGGGRYRSNNNSGDPPGEIWKPVAISALSTEAESAPPEPENGYCFLCDCSQNAREMESNPRFLKLKELWDKNCGLMDPSRNAKMCFEYYEKNIRERTQDRKYCSAAMFFAHFTVHSPTIITMMEDSLRVLNSSMATLRDGCLVEEESQSKRRRLNLRNAKMYLELFEKRKTLMQDIQGRRPTNIA